MNTRKRFTDYPASFWFATLATITAAILAISSYSRMINDDVATLKAAMIVISFEGALIVAMATMNGRLQGLLKGWAFVLLFLLAMAEIFMASMEIQHGIAQAGANAENYQQSAGNLGTMAAGMADATKALAACDARYPRKKKDAAARETCRKPYESVLNASAGSMPNNGNRAPQYDEENAGKLSQWQAVADVLNATWQPEKPITWNQAAFYVMTSIMTLFIMVKNFLWAKYAHGDELTAYLSSNGGMGLSYPANVVTVPEHHLGTPAAAVEPDTAHDDDSDDDQADTHGQPYKQPKQGFGFVPAGSRAASSADRNRATVKMENATVPQVIQLAGIPSPTVTCNTQMPVNTGNCNIQIPVENSINSENSTIYTQVQAAKVGSLVNCPNCGTAFVKANKWHTFCSNNRKPRVDGGNCSDDYHNEHNPERVVALKAKLCKQRG